ncbi:hypothetical protein [Microseira sp. BLCC-F43]|jgi:hypothetical protein|uniref:hypothetical protein n=1 Tax=Microseira sp. BLCC-F43 TaxID=3153602 RepID=UPI0035B7DAA0
MIITLPPDLEVVLQAIALRQGKDITAIAIEILTQSLAVNPNAIFTKQAKFMRFAGIAAEESAVLTSLEEDVFRDRALDLKRQVDI